MVVYFIDSLAFLSHFLIHRMAYHKEDKCVLIADKNIVDARDMTRVLIRMKELGIFQDVFFIKTLCANNKTLSIEAYEAYIREFYDEQFKSNGINLGEVERIYITVDIWCAFVSLYFDLIEKEYYQIQIGSRKDFSEVFQHPRGHFSKEFLDVANKHRMWSYSARMCVPVFYKDRPEEDKVCFNKRYEEWGGNSDLENVSDGMLQALAKAYDFDCEANEDLLYLPNSYGLSRTELNLTHNQKLSYNERLYTTEETFAGILMTGLDYYIPTNTSIAIKAHPNDPLSEESCRNIYGEGFVSLPPVPMEFLGEIMRRGKQRYKYVLGAASTSLKMVGEDIFENEFILGKSYVRLWSSYDALYSLLIVASLLERKLVADTRDIAEQLELLRRRAIVDFHYEVQNAESVDVCDYDNKGSLEDVVYGVNAITLMHRGIELYDFLRYGTGKKTVAIFNLIEAGYALPKEYEDAFTILSLNKEFSEKKAFPVGNDTQLYLFDFNKDVHRKLRTLDVTTPMRRRGFKLHISYRGEKQMDYVFLSRLNLLESNHYTMDRRTEDLNIRLSKDISFLRDVNSPSGYVPEESEDFLSFIDQLMMKRSRSIVMASVKDTPGDRLSASEIRALQILGFNNISKELWKMYVGIIDRGEVICDMVASHSEENLEFGTDFPNRNLSISIVSKAWRTGNQSQIMINGKDYSANIRGINIVVWDTVEERVVESIGFDHHMQKRRFLRK